MTAKGGCPRRLGSNPRLLPRRPGPAILLSAAQPPSAAATPKPPAPSGGTSGGLPPPHPLPPSVSPNADASPFAPGSRPSIVGDCHGPTRPSLATQSWPPTCPGTGREAWSRWEAKRDRSPTLWSRMGSGLWAPGSPPTLPTFRKSSPPPGLPPPPTEGPGPRASEITSRRRAPGRERQRGLRAAPGTLYFRVGRERAPAPPSSAAQTPADPAQQ